jgi:hypothetical protein
MAEELPFKLKLFKSLYGVGLKGFGATLLTELKKGGPAWVAFVQQLLEGSDYATRKIAVQQLTGKGFLEKHPQRAQLQMMLLQFLAKGLGDEKRMALKFIDQNLRLFPTDDDNFRSKILALQREKDPQLSALADSLLPKIGINLDDRNLYRRA